MINKEQLAKLIDLYKNEYDFKGNRIFREYRKIEVPKNHKEFDMLEFIIWANNENIAPLRESKHWLIDCIRKNLKNYLL